MVVFTAAPQGSWVPRVRCLSTLRSFELRAGAHSTTEICMLKAVVSNTDQMKPVLSKLSKVSSVFQDALVHFKASVIPTLTVQYDELFRLLLIITLCANVLQFTGLLSLHSTQAEFDRDVSKYTNLFPKQAEKLNKMSLKSRMH